ncbi:uncharacterized protein BKA55DRAFT_556669 [Fusarium redolens]|uniref:Putative 5'-nucleotidase C-terminal domain-containing protein n=1 Tax=Fusarium redolens TaxID=48865 RepID=A0A9P9KSS2_FUSRE|nr:uncharacterized protein BKA55DRAFT_556669 [Fusarium redolens]KAH7267844.1 hypothetical protein BKA55DRAFT_556669 [Fusarium redolens]
MYVDHTNSICLYLPAVTDGVSRKSSYVKGREDKPRLAITNTGGIRFDIFKGPFTRGSIYTINRFLSGFR